MHYSLVVFVCFISSATCYQRRLYRKDTFAEKPFLVGADVILTILEWNSKLEAASREGTAAEYRWESNITEYNANLNNKIASKNALVNKQVWQEARELKNACYTCSEKWQRQLLLHSSNIGSSALSEDKFDEFQKTVQIMSSTYSTGKVCNLPGFNSDSCVPLDPDLTELFKRQGNYCLLTDAWKKWRDVSGKKIRKNYTRYVELQNEAAKTNGFENAKDMWLEDYTTGNSKFMKEIMELWNELEPFYQQLHAYVRSELIELYGSDKFPQSGHIPAHLFGNMWAQNWAGLINLVEPYPEAGSLNITNGLLRQNATVETIVKMAEDFYQSLGMDPMTKKFWKNSVFERKLGVEMVCHASAYDMYNGSDYRIKMCGAVSMEDFQTLHHEMGHIQYYMHYKHQYYPFRDSANPGFHEAVGDAITISAMNPLHLQKLGLLTEKEFNDDNEDNVLLNAVMLQALFKVAFLPFGLLVDLFRLQTFTGETRSDNYNKAWWQLRCGLQGVSPPVHRSELDFDPGAKFHIASDSQYMGYFVAILLQFDFHENICRKMGFEKDFHKCDISGHPDAAKNFRKMMSFGKSKPYPEILKIVTGGRSSMSARPMLRFFQPLQDWLIKKNQNSNVDVGWDNSKCPTPIYIC